MAQAQVEHHVEEDTPGPALYKPVNGDLATKDTGKTFGHTFTSLPYPNITAS